MRLTALVTACVVAVALAGPVPQGPYLVRRPHNSVSLHSQAQQRNLNAGGQQQFLVSLDSSENSREDAVISLQGVGNFAATSSLAPASPSIRTSQGPPQSFSLDGGAQFNVEVDDNSRESVELRLSSFASPVECPVGQLRHGSRCVVPRINRNIFVFGKDDPPEQKSIDSSELPLPQLDYNIIFVRSRGDRQRSPIVVPPAQKKTVVYVLEDEDVDKEIIEVPAYPDADPEVYYVKVRPGENPQLPGGLDLETAYSQAIRPSGSQETSFESSIELNIGAGGSVSAAGTDAFSGSAQGTASFNSGDAGFSSSDDFGVPLPATSSSRDDLGFNGGNAGFGSSSAVSNGNAGFDSGSNAFTGDNAGFGSSSNAVSNGNAGFDSGSNAGFDSSSNAFSGSNGNAGFDSSSNAFSVSNGNAGFDSSSNAFSGSNAFSNGNAGFDSASTSFNGGNAGFDAGFSNTGSSANNGGTVGVPLPAFKSNDFNVNSNSGNGANGGFNNGFSGNSGSPQTFSGSAQFTAESSFGNGQGFNSNIDFAAKGLSVEIDDGVIKVEASSDEVVRPALRYRLPTSG